MLAKKGILRCVVEILLVALEVVNQKDQLDLRGCNYIVGLQRSLSGNLLGHSVLKSLVLSSVVQHRTLNLHQHFIISYLLWKILITINCWNNFHFQYWCAIS
jgi:hypothetical protein